MHASSPIDLVKPQETAEAYRLQWTESIALARKDLDFLIRSTSDLKAGNQQNQEIRTVTDRCIRAYLSVYEASMEIKNAADVLNRLEVEPELLLEAVLARRASIKLFSDLRNGVMMASLIERASACDKLDLKNPSLEELYGRFDQVFTKLAVADIPETESAELAARQRELLVRFKKDVAETVWPVIALIQAEIAGLTRKAIAKSWREEKAVWEFTLKPSDVDDLMSRANSGLVRERVYKEHLPLVLAVGYEYGHQWVQLQRQYQTEPLTKSLLIQTGLRSCSEMIEMFAALNKGTRGSLLVETARIRAAVRSGELDTTTYTFQPWDTEWVTKRYEIKANARPMISASDIRCFEWSLLLTALLDLAGGLFGCRFVRDETMQPSEGASDRFEVWRVYDTIDSEKADIEMGRLFIDFATTRRSDSARRYLSRYMPVLSPAPFGSSEAPQVLWTISHEMPQFSVTGVRTLAEDLSRIVDTLILLASDPTYKPSQRQESHAQLSLSAYIMGDLFFDDKIVDKMLSSADKQQDMGKRVRRSVMLTRTHEMRAFFGQTHALVAAAHAMESRGTLTREQFAEVHKQTIESWGTHLPMSSRLPQTILRGGQAWPGDLRRDCVNISNQISSSQIIARLLPGGIDGGFDQDVVEAYRSHVRSQLEEDPAIYQAALLAAIGGSLRPEAFAERLENDLKVFDIVEDERLRVLRPIVLKLIQRRKGRLAGPQDGQSDPVQS